MPFSKSWHFICCVIYKRLHTLSIKIKGWEVDYPATEGVVEVLVDTKEKIFQFLWDQVFPFEKKKKIKAFDVWLEEILNVCNPVKESPDTDVKDVKIKLLLLSVE